MLRYALAPRWWVTHCLVAAAFLGCMRLGLWQLQVAQGVPAGATWDLRNSFYASQWIFFACFGLWFWGRFLRDQRAADEAADAAYAAWADQQEAELPDSLTG